MTGPDIVARIRDLAGVARRLPPPSPRRPDAFHEARSELGHDLDLVAREIEQLLGLRSIGKRFT